MLPKSPVACPVCGSNSFQVFFSIQELPTISVALWPDKERARTCARGEIALSGCRSCAFIENVSFDPKLIEYDAKYENALHFSGVYRQYAQAEAEALIDRHELRGKRIVEIGCGDAQFLSELCRLGGNTGTGYDPSFVPDAHAHPLDPGVRVERRYFTAEDVRSAPDLILCRQVLEHIPNPSAFIRTLHKDLEGHSETLLSFEVPNAEHLIRNLSVWDLTYEHCSYFTEPALRRLFQLCGFRVHDIREGFGGQNLTIEASRDQSQGKPSPRLTPETRERIEALAVQMTAFRDEASARISRWSPQLREWRGAGARARTISRSSLPSMLRQDTRSKVTVVDFAVRAGMPSI